MGSPEQEWHRRRRQKDTERMQLLQQEYLGDLALKHRVEPQAIVAVALTEQSGDGRHLHMIYLTDHGIEHLAGNRQAARDIYDPLIREAGRMSTVEFLLAGDGHEYVREQYPHTCLTEIPGSERVIIEYSRKKQVGVGNLLFEAKR